MPLTINGGKGTLLDISRGGLGISPEIIPVGETIYVGIKINGKDLELEGKIKWIKFKDTYGGACRVGFSITKAPENYYRFVDSLQQGEGEMEMLN